MISGRLISLAFGPAVAVALAIPASAQTTRGVTQNPPGQDGADNANGDANSRTQRPPSPFNDPAAQLRRLRSQVATAQTSSGSSRGGRGGSFGGFGGGGGIQSVLTRNTALQEAIGMTAEQVKAFDNLNDAASDQRRELFRSMRGNNQGGNNGGGRGGRGGFDPAMMQKMQQMMATQAQEQKSALTKILSKKQMSRLNQIRLQILGPLGVAEQDVAQAMLLTSDQYAQIQQIMQAMETQRQEMRRAAFAQMAPPGGFGRGGPGGPGGGPGAAAGGQARQGGPGGAAPGGQAGNQTRGARTPTGAPGQAADNADNGGRQRGRGGFDPNSPEFKAMQERMQKMTEDDAALEKKAITAIGRLLTPKQKALFNKMLGEPYDLTKLVDNQRGPGGRGGPGGAPGGAPGGRTTTAPPRTNASR